MPIPGDRRSPFPDECGNQAGIFAEAVRDGDMNLAWSVLSKETRGMRMGVWATRYRVDMQVAYRAGYNLEHPMRAAMLEDFRTTVLRLWPLEDLTDLGISPTSYVDNEQCLCLSALRNYRGQYRGTAWPGHERLNPAHAAGGRRMEGGLARLAVHGTTPRRTIPRRMPPGRDDPDEGQQE